MSNRLGITNRGSIVSIGNLEVPRGASSLSYTYQDLSDSDAGRSMSGSMWKGVFGCVRKYSISFNARRPAEIAALLQELRLKNSVEMVFYDWEAQAYVVTHIYAGDRTVKVCWFHDNHELADLSFSAIDVDPYTS